MGGVMSSQGSLSLSGQRREDANRCFGAVDDSDHAFSALDALAIDELDEGL